MRRALHICLFFASIMVYGQDFSATLARRYYEEAQNAYEAGQEDLALEFLAKSLESNPVDPDALYLRSLVPSDPVELRGFLENVVALDPGHDEAAFRLAEIYRVAKRFREARDLVAGRNPVKPEHFIVLARLDFALGDDAGGLEVLERGHSRFPTSYEIVFEELSRNASAYSAEFLDTFYHTNKDDTRFLELYLPYVADKTRRSTVISDYLALGGRGLGVIMAAIMDNPGRELSFVSVFLENEVFAREDLVDLESFLQIEESKRLLATFLSSFTGTVTGDPDADGYSEQRSTLESGDLVHSSIDSNQDGIPDFVYSVESGDVILTWGGEADSYRVFYSPYPYASSLEIERGQSLVRGFFSPRNQGFSVLEWVGQGPLKYPVATFSPDPRWNWQEFVYLREEFDQGEKIRRIHVENGLPRIVEENPSREGRFLREVLYEKGVPVSGEVDSDADGYKETVEIYDGGTMTGYTVDTDRNGRIDVKILTVGASYWDYDQDGIFDCVTYGEDEYERWYSSKLDGNYDVTIKAGEDGIVVISRNGKSESVVEHDGILWIGPRSESPIARNEGVQRVDGRRVLVFRFQGDYYAEIVR